MYYIPSIGSCNDISFLFSIYYLKEFEFHFSKDKFHFLYKNFFCFNSFNFFSNIHRMNLEKVLIKIDIFWKTRKENEILRVFHYILRGQCKGLYETSD